MGQYSKESIRTFMNQQEKLFGTVVADTEEEAVEILEECMAVEVKSLRDVREFFDENGMDVSGMSKEELLDQDEVFPLPSGKFLLVVG